LRELEEKRDKILKEFNDFLLLSSKRYEESREERRQIWKGEASDEEKYKLDYDF
jgi:hypothetical protein